MSTETPKHNIMNRLYLDCETSPNVVLSWRVGYKINIDHDNILQERKIICIGYKWEGEKSAKVITWDKDMDDKAMLTKFSEIMQDADEIVAHNGDNFDLPWLQTRFAFHRIPPPPRIKTVDTLQWMRRRLYLNSNRLDYAAQYFGFGRKMKAEFQLWRQVIQNDRKALKRMSEYCARDVNLLEKVFHAIHPYAGVAKTHAGVLAGGEKWTCPYTGSKNVQSRGREVTAAGTQQYRMKCMDSGRWFKISAKSHADYQEYREEQEKKQKEEEAE